MASAVDQSGSFWWGYGMKGPVEPAMSCQPPLQQQVTTDQWDLLQSVDHRFCLQVCQLHFTMLEAGSFQKGLHHAEPVISSMNQPINWVTGRKKTPQAPLHGTRVTTLAPCPMTVGPGPPAICSQDLARGQSACDPGRFRNELVHVAYMVKTTWIGSVVLFCSFKPT